eukprot:s922_g2.t1
MGSGAYGSGLILVQEQAEEPLAQRLTAASRCSGGWSAAFARCRARLSLLLIQLVQRSDLPQLRSAVLTAVEGFKELEGDALQHAALRAFAAEASCFSVGKLGEEKLSRLIVLFLAKGCHTLRAPSERADDPVPAMLEALVQQHFLPSLLEIVDEPEGQDPTNHKEALPQAAAWLLAALARSSGRAKKVLLDALNSRDLLGKAAASQFAAGCIDESLLTGLTPSARANLAEALKSLPDLGEEWKQRQSSLAQALGQGSATAGALLPSPLGQGKMAAQLAGWCHLAAVVGPVAPERQKTLRLGLGYTVV